MPGGDGRLERRLLVQHPATFWAQRLGGYKSRCFATGQALRGKVGDMVKAATGASLQDLEMPAAILLVLRLVLR